VETLGLSTAVTGLGVSSTLFPQELTLGQDLESSETLFVVGVRYFVSFLDIPSFCGFYDCMVLFVRSLLANPVVTFP